MLPTKTPLRICWAIDAPRSALRPSPAKPAPPLLDELELAERRIEVLHLAESGLDVVAAALAARLLDGLGDDQDAGVRLGGELVGVYARLLHRGEELLVGGLLAERVPRGADHHTVGGRAGVLDEGRAVEAVAA